MRRYDAVAIGSGINSLVAAALLAKKGWKVCVLERNDWLGGAIRTAEITERGFVHEVYSSWHPLFAGSAAYAELKGDLDARGLEYLNTELATATLFPDGRSVFLTTSHEENVNGARPGLGAHGRRVPAAMPTSHSACSARSSGRGTARSWAGRR